MTSGQRIGWYINEWLDVFGMSQKDVAQITGWSKQKVSALCVGSAGYNRPTIETLAKALGIHPSELLLHPNRALVIRRLLQEGGDSQKP